MITAHAKKLYGRKAIRGGTEEGLEIHSVRGGKTSERGDVEVES